MRGYRHDARPTCNVCKRAFDASELAPDENGKPRCRGCGAAADASALERRADVSRKAERKRRVLLRASVAGIVFVGAIGLYWSSASARKKSLALAEAEASMRRSLEPVQRLFERASEQRGRECDGLEIDGSALWLVADLNQPLGFDFEPPPKLVWQTGLNAPPLWRSTSVEEARVAQQLVESTRYAVVLVERVTRPRFWGGDLWIVDRQPPGLLCRTPVEVDGDRGHFPIDAQKLRATAAAAIPKGLALVN